ncbi:DUF4339 domain-containing protein [Ekhidna sp.]|uniref:DUF4339 domain-containing protein n=1 Tax=Ekhidna sp. TaxID=2608089 RepID=UPI0032EDA7D3
MSEYYLAENNEQTGPFTIEQLKKGEIAPETLVWKEGLADWTEARNVKELQDLFKTTPPPLPPSNTEKNTPTTKPKTKGVAEKLTEQKRKTVAAKEVKLSGKILIYSLLIGIASYPIFAFKGFKAISLKNQYEELRFSSSRQLEDVKRSIVDLIPEDEKWDSQGYFWSVDIPAGSISGSGTREWNYDRILYWYGRKITGAIGYSIGVMIAAFLILFIGRYLFLGGKKGVNWVSENSKEKA